MEPCDCSSMNIFDFVDGVMVPRMSSERWQKLQKYPLRSDDVIISSFPRSGSTWTQHIVRLLRNGGIDDGVSLDDAVPLLDSLGSVKGNSLKLNPNAADELPSPRSMKVHLPYHMTPGGIPHTTGVKYIYVARNPKDVCVSLWHFNQKEVGKMTGTNWSISSWDLHLANFMEAKESSGIYGGWLNHVLGWWEHRDAKNILFIRYETMSKEPYKIVQKIAEFMDMKNASQELIETVCKKASFSSMCGNPGVNNRKRAGAREAIAYLRKGIVGDWKECFTDEQNMEFEIQIVRKLKEYDLEFEYD